MASELVKLGASPPAGTGQNLQHDILTYHVRTYVSSTHGSCILYNCRAYHLRTCVRQAHDLLAEDPLLALSMKLRPALVGGHHGEALGGVLALLALQRSALHLGSVGGLVVHGEEVHIQVVAYTAVRELYVRTYDKRTHGSQSHGLQQTYVSA